MGIKDDLERPLYEVENVYLRRLLVILFAPTLFLICIAKNIVESAIDVWGELIKECW